MVMTVGPQMFPNIPKNVYLIWTDEKKEFLELLSTTKKQI